MTCYPATRSVLAIGLFVGFVVGTTTMPARAVPDVNRYREFSLPTAVALPKGITAGPDGNLWFTEAGGNRIGRITTGGVIRESPSKAGIGPTEIAAGPDGNLWFTEWAGNAIAASRLL